MKIKPLYSTFNPKAGMTARFVIEIPQDFVLIIDTREANPLFIGHGSLGREDYFGELLVTRRMLDFGDYSCKGFEGEILIERKAISDLYSSLFVDWEREKKKLNSLKKFFRKFLVIEGTESDVLRYQDFSKVSPNSMRGRLCEIELRLGIPIYYAENRKEAERYILYRLTKYMRLKRSGEIQ